MCMQAAIVLQKVVRGHQTRRQLLRSSTHQVSQATMTRRSPSNNTSARPSPTPDQHLPCEQALSGEFASYLADDGVVMSQQRRAEVQRQVCGTHNNRGCVRTDCASEKLKEILLCHNQQNGSASTIVVGLNASAVGHVKRAARKSALAQ